MVDVPRRDPLNDPTNPEHDAKRLRNVIDGFSTRGDRGGSKWPQPVGNNDRNRAGARSLGGRVTISGNHKSKIDQFTITDPEDLTYPLTYAPLPGSWNVIIGSAGQYEEDYAISGKTITFSADARLRVDDRVRVQYDYVPAGTAIVIPPPTPPGSPPTGEDSGGGTALNAHKTIFLPSSIDAGDAILVIGITKNELWSGSTGLDSFSGPADEIMQNPAGPEHFHLLLWYKVADGTEGGTPVTVTQSETAWMSVHYVVYKEATPTLIASDSQPGSTDYTTPAGAPTDGWTVYVIGHGYGGAVKTNTDLVIDYPSAGIQGNVAVFHAASTQNAEDFTSGSTYGWASHVLSVEG